VRRLAAAFATATPPPNQNSRARRPCATVTPACPEPRRDRALGSVAAARRLPRPGRGGWHFGRTQAWQRLTHLSLNATCLHGPILDAIPAFQSGTRQNGPRRESGKIHQWKNGVEVLQWEGSPQGCPQSPCRSCKCTVLSCL